MAQGAPAEKITDLEERSRSGVLRYCPIGYSEAGYEPEDADIPAVFRTSPRLGVDLEAGAAVAQNRSIVIWTVASGESVRMSFLVNRRAFEPGFDWARQNGAGRRPSHTLPNYTTSRAPEPLTGV